MGQLCVAEGTVCRFVVFSYGHFRSGVYGA